MPRPWPVHPLRPLPFLALFTVAAAGLAHAKGVDAAGMDRSVAPGDDFFAHANGGWVKKTPIPADRSSWGVGAELAEKTDARLRALLEKAATDAPAGSERRKVGDFYASLMDEATIEAKGLAPLAPALDRIAAVARAKDRNDRKALARLLGSELRADVDPLNNSIMHTTRLFGLWVAADLDAPDRNAPFLLQGGLGMPDREYYLSDDKRMVELRAKYGEHVAAVFRLAGSRPDEATARAARVLALETGIARAHASREDSSDVRKANNHWPRTEFAKRAPGLDWDAFFEAAQLGDARAVPTVIVWQPDAVKGIAALVASEPLEAWTDWLALHTIDRRSPVLPRAFVEEHFAFHGRALSGTPALGERWKRAMAITNDLVGWSVGKLYVEEHFPPASKAQVERMVRDIIAAFGARIDKLDWMAAATRARAREKLATLYVGVGYPERWPDTASLEVIRGDALGNVERAELFELRRNLAKLGRPVDKKEWCMHPQLVNAVNLPVQNAMNFPAAILQPPFFDPTAPAAVNYGSIGSVIGHEISHSFDDQGAQFDAQGRLADWWTKEDREHFETAGRKLVAQYDAYRPFPDLAVNGKLTLGENIADLAGLAAALDAWRSSLGRPATRADDKQFFLAFAQGWRGKAREESLRRQVLTDGHSPRMYRVATVRNLDAWYAAFGVRPRHKLYLAPEARVRVW